MKFFNTLCLSCLKFRRGALNTDLQSPSTVEFLAVQTRTCNIKTNKTEGSRLWDAGMWRAGAGAQVLELQKSESE